MIHVERHSLSIQLKRHELTHALDRSGNLKNHKTTHAGIIPFTCDTCGKSFTLLASLKRHELTHTGVKPFTCDTCGKSFTHFASLKRHEMTHTGVKPFICDTCGKSFARHTGATRGRINCGSTILITVNKSTNKTNYKRPQWCCAITALTT